ncbi:MAG: hypothetical protein ACFFAY_13530 [Promethearchaeota archaeon]
MRQKTQVAAGLSLLLLLVFGCLDGVANSIPSESHPGNALWIEPSNASLNEVGSKVNLTVWLNVSLDTFAWQLKILFNSTYFKVSQLGYTAGDRSEFLAGHSTISIDPILNNSEGYVIMGETLLGNDKRNPGCDSLVWLELNLTEAPQALQFAVSFSVPYGADTFVLTPSLDVVAMDTSVGSVLEYQQVPQDNLIRDIVIIAAVLGLAGTLLVLIRKRRRDGNEEH